MSCRRLQQSIGVFLLMVMLTSSCKGGNIFGFRGAADDNTGDLIAEGQELLRDAKYEEAEVVFAKAKQADTMNSDARFFHAKAALLKTGQSVVTLLREMTQDSQQVGGQLPLYSPDPNLSQADDDARKTALYQAAQIIIDDLEPIAQGLTTGSFDANSINLDLALGQVIFALLRLRDTNNNMEIQTPPDFFIDIFRLNNDEFGFGDLGEVLCPPGATPAEKDANIISFNDALADVASGDSENPSLIVQILKNLQQEGLLGNDSAVDVDELEDAIGDVGDTIVKYFVNNGVPGNPGEGDNDGDGRTDEEILDGIDNDNDGLVDEDARSF